MQSVGVHSFFGKGIGLLPFRFSDKFTAQRMMCRSCALWLIKGVIFAALLLPMLLDEASKRLQAAGYEHIRERDAWELKPGGR